MNNFFKNTTVRSLVLILMLQFMSCGLILHPERNGQKKTERLDTAIVVLDGIGLFFFVVPGLVAFAVDFLSGTIYLPSGNSKKSSIEPNLKNVVGIKVEKEGLTKKNIEFIIKAYTGKSVNLSNPNLKVTYKNIQSKQYLVGLFHETG